MSSEKNWKYPDWIYAALHKIDSLDLSKFLFPVYITRTILRPEDNKYFPQWAIKVMVEVDVKDRINGKNLSIISSDNGVYIYRSSDVEDVIFEELHKLISHELRECFQVRESGKDATIPFDPHTGKITTMYAYRKVAGFPLYPHFRSIMWITCKKIFHKIRAKISNKILSVITRVTSKYKALSS